MRRAKVLNSPAIRRMPTYLHKLMEMKAEGRRSVSSVELAEYMDMEPIVVRKDIALTGISGQRRVGFEVNELISYIKDYLGWQNSISAVLIGAGALGTALLGYDDFSRYGLNVEAVFDADPAKKGHVVRGAEVKGMDELEDTLRNAPPDVAIICVPASAAQLVADKVVSHGVKFIWNFANVALKVPHGVIVQREVIAGGLAMLTVKMKNFRGSPDGKVVID